MKEPISDEILSAYVDGELSAAERAEIERWLETNSAARERLDDFRRLSGLFASLPRTEVPQEFPTKVLQMAERRMLLPESLGVPTLGVPTRARSAVSRGMRHWAFAAGAPVAASLLVILYLSFRDPGLPQIELAGKDQAALPAPGGVNGVVKAKERGESEREGELLAQKGDVESPHRYVESQLKSSDSAAGTAAPAAAASPAGGGAGAPPRAMAALRAAGKRDATNFAAPVLGAPAADAVRAHPELAEINRALQDLGEGDKDHALVSVVKVYVADSAQGMVLLQKVFSDNEVLSERDDRAGGSKREGQRDGSDRDSPSREPDHLARKSKSASRPEAAASGATEALYVIAEPEQLIAAFTEILSREDPAIRLAIEEPIEIAALDARLQKQMKQVAPESVDIQSRRRESSAKGSVAGENAPAPAPIPADGKPAADKAPAENPSKADEKSDLKGLGRGSTNRAPEKKAAAPPPQAMTKEQSQSKRKELPDPENAAVAKKGAAAIGGAPPFAPGQSAPGQSAPGQSATGQSATGQSATGQSATGQSATGQSRQLVVPMPDAIRQRMGFGGTKQRTTRDVQIVEKAKAPAALSDNAVQDEKRDEQAKSVAEKDQVQRAPTLVRVLIVIEREVARPAASPPAGNPPAGKGPSGGAS